MSGKYKNKCTYISIIFLHFHNCLWLFLFYTIVCSFIYLCAYACTYVCVVNEYELFAVCNRIIIIYHMIKQYVLSYIFQVYTYIIFSIYIVNVLVRLSIYMPVSKYTIQIIICYLCEYVCLYNRYVF